MNDSELLKTLKDHADQIESLQKKIHFQEACFQTLRTYCLRRICDLAKADRKKEIKELNKLLRRTYDQYITKIEKIEPGYAARIDVRADMGKVDQETWYLPTEES